MLVAENDEIATLCSRWQFFWTAGCQIGSPESQKMPAQDNHKDGFVQGVGIFYEEFRLTVM